MPYLCLAFVLVSLVNACGSDAAAPVSLGEPALQRRCGQLEGVDSIEPLVRGSSSNGCALFDPVPCAEPRDYYDAVCGEGCGVLTAVDEDGDSWALGCVATSGCPIGPQDSPDGSGFSIPSACRRNPASGAMLWFISGWCGASNEPMTCDWQPCNDDRSTRRVPVRSSGLVVADSNRRRPDQN